MTSPDTGWVTDENPASIRALDRYKNFHPPLDEIDGAARILDPVFKTINDGAVEYGVFYKDYKPTDW